MEKILQVFRRLIESWLVSMCVHLCGFSTLFVKLKLWFFFPSTDKYKHLACVIHKFFTFFFGKIFFSCVNICVNGAT